MDQVPPVLLYGESADTGCVTRAADVSIDPTAVDDAKPLGINIPPACEAGLKAEVARTRREIWLAENREALESSNAYVEKYGLPLADLRQF